MKLLIIEDNKTIADSIKKGMELKSHVVDVAYDGETGYDLASSEPYDVIILDRMLPGIDGLEICKNLRQEGNTTPILMLTAKTLTEDKVDGLESGADDYLSKPFEFTELVARINALARRPLKLVEQELQVADLQLSTSTMEVTRSGTAIHLSPKEFALLEFFMRHPGQIFTKEQLTEHVWTFDADVLPNTAQVYVGYLRNKIDRPFPYKPELIKTNRGFGYKIEDEA